MKHEYLGLERYMLNPAETKEYNTIIYIILALFFAYIVKVYKIFQFSF